MHIVLANQWYPPESGWGGLGMWNYAMARAYRDLGHQVTVIASRTSEQIPAEHETDGISVRRLLVSDAYRWRRLPVTGRYVRPLQQLTYARRVDRALRALNEKQPIDVVEFAEINAEGFFYVRAPQAPVVVRCHTPTFVLKRYYSRAEMRFDTKIIGRCEKALIRHAHARTAPSRDMAQLIAKECGLPLESIAVIPNALPVDESWSSLSRTPRNGSITILHVGRMERAKGVRVLAQAIPNVVRQVPNARFVFLGEDLFTERGISQREELIRQLDSANVLKSVEFVGGVDQRTLVEWYGRADICVVPSLNYESFSYTCAEAMAAGKPVVASRIGGIPETVDDGKSGILATPGSPEELAEAILRLARDASLRERMGHAGQEKAKSGFDPLRIAELNLEVYARARCHFEAQAR